MFGQPLSVSPRSLARRGARWCRAPRHFCRRLQRPSRERTSSRQQPPAPPRRSADRPAPARPRLYDLVPCWFISEEALVGTCKKEQMLGNHYTKMKVATREDNKATVKPVLKGKQLPFAMYRAPSA